MLNEKLLIDTVIENGNNGTWTWTKWKSGKVELYGFIQFTGLNATTQSMGTYYGASKTVTLPITFSSTICINATSGGVMSSGVWVYRSFVNGNQLQSEFRGHASISGGTCGVHYHIIGYL